MNNFNFNPNEVISDLPDGPYQGMIIKTDVKDNKAKTGYYLELIVQITQGPHQGYELTERLNVSNPNPVAVNLAKRRLRDYCVATHINSEFTDPNILLNIPFMITTKTRVSNDPQFPDRPEIASVKKLGTLDGLDSTPSGRPIWNTPPVTPPVPPVAPLPEDDIPF